MIALLPLPHLLRIGPGVRAFGKCQAQPADGGPAPVRIVVDANGDDRLRRSACRIAETQRVPPKYLELIMLDLKKAGLVKSARGPKGGYQLSRPAEQISFGEIVRTMEGPIALVSCASVNFYAPCGDCHDEATCAIRRAFTILRDQSTAVLDSISLAEGAHWEERLGNGI